MVLLVRCSDNTCSVALKSRIKELINDGLITAYFQEGEWVVAEKTVIKREYIASQQPSGNLASLAAPL
jgi:hypothetical protein